MGGSPSRPEDTSERRPLPRRPLTLLCGDSEFLVLWLELDVHRPERGPRFSLEQGDQMREVRVPAGAEARHVRQVATLGAVREDEQHVLTLRREFERDLRIAVA